MPFNKNLDAIPLRPRKPLPASQNGDGSLRLNFNESPYGASPKVKQYCLDTIDVFEQYPDGTQEPLVSALAEKYRLETANIAVLSGTTEAIAVTLRAMLNQGDEVVTSINGFPANTVNMMACGATIIKVAEEDNKVSVDNLLNAVTDKTKIVLVCNPNNPTGTYLPFSEIKRLADNLPEHVYLLMDDAYAEYAQYYDDYQSGLALFAKTGRVLVTRTFSKAYGLAAQRVGWVVAPDDVMGSLRKIPFTFSVGPFALKLATVALQDDAYMRDVVVKNQAVKEKFTAQIEKLGITVVPSATNFVLLQFPAGDKNGMGAYDYLAERGMLTQPPSPESAQNLRITLGLPHHMDTVAQHIADYLQGV